MSALTAATVAACGGEPAIPAVVGEDMAFARGAMSSASLEYEVEEVDIEDPDQDGLVQDAYYEDDTLILEVGTLPVITLNGDFTLTEAKFPRISDIAEGDRCSGSGGYSDFRAGMNVTIRDGDGDIVGSTSTGPAEYVKTRSTSEALHCRTAFEIDVDIVDFYSIEIGRRGELTYSFEDLEDQDFHVSLTLGD